MLCVVFLNVMAPFIVMFDSTSFTETINFKSTLGTTKTPWLPSLTAGAYAAKHFTVVIDVIDS
jgi:hypothetical protein